MSVLLLYGGGIDSTTLAAHYHFNKKISIHCVFFRYGQKAERLEEESCRYFCNKYGHTLHCIDLPLSSISNSAILSTATTIANDPSVNILDGRNLVFLSFAAMLGAKLGVSKLAMGFHIEPPNRPFPDASIEFFHAANEVLKQGVKHPLELEAPFIGLTREDIFKEAQWLDPYILKNAHTCYEDVPGGCGECTHCKYKASILG